MLLTAQTQEKRLQIDSSFVYRLLRKRLGIRDDHDLGMLLDMWDEHIIS